MKPYFTLEYSEFEFADALASSFDKDEYSVVIPASRQQKYYDVALLKLESRKVKTFQVKSSRYYETALTDRKKYHIDYHGWFNKLDKIDKNLDFIVLTVYFPSIPKTGEKGRITMFKASFVFTPEEVKSYNMDRQKFYIGIDGNDKYFVCRSVDPPKDIGRNKYESWIDPFKERF